MRMEGKEEAFWTARVVSLAGESSPADAQDCNNAETRQLSGTQALDCRPTHNGSVLHKASLDRSLSCNRDTAWLMAR